jgi:hypothetical protein
MHMVSYQVGGVEHGVYSQVLRQQEWLWPVRCLSLEAAE